MAYNENWKTYTKAVVKILCKGVGGDETYIISNVNSKGIPLKDCESHLESITIESPVIGGVQDNSAQISAKGTIVLVDYRDSIFTRLVQHLGAYIGIIDTDQSSTGFRNIDLLPWVDIQITCYTNAIRYIGHITNWTFSFSGSTPSLQLSWSTICPEQIPKKQFKLKANYNKVSSFIQDLRSSFDSINTKFVFTYKNKEYDGSSPEIDSVLEFINGSYSYNPGPSRLANPIIAAYCTLTDNIKTKDGLLITGEKSDIKDEFNAYIKNANKNAQDTELSNICADLVFVQQSTYNQFEKTPDGKTIVPITDFSFDTDFSKIALQTKIITNMNGNQSISNGGVSITNGTPSESAAAAISDSANASSDAVTIKFSCYNVMAFDRNNLNAPINIRIFNEHGDPHIISGKAMVRDFSYHISSGVVKADVTATQVFNTMLTSTENKDGSSSSVSFNELADRFAVKSALANYANQTGNLENDQEGPLTSSNNMSPYKLALISEDKHPINIKYDNTLKLVKDGTFAKHVDAFMNKFANTKLEAGHVIDYDFTQTLIAHGNFGLLTLLIGVANYGISGYIPDYLEQDPVILGDDYKNRTAFCASDTGKTPYDCENGGLGIAHWDSSNLIEIYQTCGFDLDIDRKHFENLLVHDDSIIDWKEGVFINEPRLFPIFNKKKSDPVLFDKGLKQDAQWLRWANRILSYNAGSDTGRIFQQYLFKLWIDKMWEPVYNKLKSINNSGDHKICIQDIVRISRARSSATSYTTDYDGKTVCGKNVEIQYIAYANDKKRYMRQKAFCRRCCDIIGTECYRQYGDSSY